MTQDQLIQTQKQSQTLHKFNHAMPMTEEYNDLLNELFNSRIGQNSSVSSPLSGTCFDNVEIGDNVFVNSNVL